MYPDLWTLVSRLNSRLLSQMIGRSANFHASSLSPHTCVLLVLLPLQRNELSSTSVETS